MNSTKRSFALIKASQKVFSINPWLIVYPFILAACTLLLISAFLLPHTVEFGPLKNRAIDWLISFASFLCVQWVTIFLNTAFYLAADSALKGERLPFRQAIAQTWLNRKLLSQWALFAGLIGFIISRLEQNFSFLGSISARFIGIAWSLASIFAIPVIIHHQMSPMEALKYSSKLFKKTWGEQLVVAFSLGSILFIPVFIFGLVIFSFVLQVYTGQITLLHALTVGIILLIPVIVLGSYINSIETIFNAALFRYADTGDYVGPFSPELIQGAYRSRKAKQGKKV